MIVGLSECIIRSPDSDLKQYSWKHCHRESDILDWYRNSGRCVLGIFLAFGIMVLILSLGLHRRSYHVSKALRTLRREEVAQVVPNSPLCRHTCCRICGYQLCTEPVGLCVLRDYRTPAASYDQVGY